MESGAEPPVAQRLRCDLAELVDAFVDASWEMSVYLDLDTGEVIHVTADSTSATRGWQTPHAVVHGVVPGLVLAPTELLWLRAC